LIFGSLGGVFMLGLLTKKANTKGVLIGIVVSFTIQKEIFRIASPKRFF